MKKLTILIACLVMYSLHANSQEIPPLPNFAKTLPFDGMKKKVKSATLKQMFGEIKKNDTIYTLENIHTTFYNKAGNIDSVYIITPRISIAAKFYLKDFRRLRSQASHIDGIDTTLVSTSAYTYRVLNKDPLVIEATEFKLEDGNTTAVADTTLFDTSNDSSAQKMPNGSIQRTYYKNHQVSEIRFTQNGRDQYRSVFEYNDKQLIKQIHSDDSSRKGTELKIIYPKYDKQGNWTEQLYISDGKHKERIVKIERVIEYWK